MGLRRRGRALVNQAQPVWKSLIGQEVAVAKLSDAARSARRILDAQGTDAERIDADRSAMSHAWLITGPPGSGRSNAAKAFAAALQCVGEEPGCGVCPGCRTTMLETNGDVHFVRTQKTIISVDSARGLVNRAQASPSQGRWRVILIEDADRLNEQAANALLKAIEEPPERTVWLLCAPSSEDMIQTIRSRCRHLVLRIPSVHAVAKLLMQEGIADEATALEAARAAQSHIGRARGLAKDPEARRHRRDIITAPAKVRSVGEAVFAAENLWKTAKADADARTKETDARERAELLRVLGLEESAQSTRIARAQLRQLEEEQKRRSRRALTDELDRALVDLLSIYRDVLMVQLNADQELINSDLADLVHELAQESTPRQTMARVSAIEQARRRLLGNGQAQLVLEAMTVSLRPRA